MEKSNFEGQIESGQQQPPALGDLKKSREDLEAKVLAAKKQKEEDIIKQLRDREATIAESARLSELLKEAESTLGYFETQNQQGLLTDEKDFAELERLRELVATLHKQEVAIDQKYEAIMNNPEVFDKVYEEALQEKKSQELRASQEEALESLQKRVETLIKKIVGLSSDIDSQTRVVDLSKNSLETAIADLKKIIDKACENLSSDQYRTSRFLKDLIKPGDYGERITQAESYRKKLGWFAGKEKAAVDFVRNQKIAFANAEKGMNNYNIVRQNLDALNAKVDELAEEYKQIMLDAWTKEKQINAEFSVASGLPSSVYYRINDGLKKRSGIKRQSGKDNQWVEIGEVRGQRPTPEREKFNKLSRILNNIEKVAGRYLHIIDPDRS